MFMPREQNSGIHHNINIGYKLFATVEQCKYFRAAIANQNTISEEIKSRLNSGSAG
jgi:hypothetical protein